MIEILSVDNMRKSDAWTINNKIPSKILMERAGKGIFDKVNKLNKWVDKVAIVCGSGNNAGDGYVIALQLKNIGINCDIILIKEKFSNDGKFYFQQCLNYNIPYQIYNNTIDFNTYAVIVDCIFGTGFVGNVKSTSSEIIKKINLSNAYVISVDINSGLNGDTGQSKLCVKSNLTISVGGFKTGHFLGISDKVIMRKENIDIGIKPILPAYLLVNENEYKNLSKEYFNKYKVIKNVNDITLD